MTVHHTTTGTDLCKILYHGQLLSGFYFCLTAE